MVGSRAAPNLEAANLFRHGLFQCFFENDDPSIRADALKTLGHVFGYWSNLWLDYQCKTPVSPVLARPSLVRHSSSGSGISSASGNLLRRDSSFKMQFDDIFGADGDDIFSNAGSMRRKDSVVSSPLTPDKECTWTTFVGECAVSPSDVSGPAVDRECAFSNKGIGTIDTAIADVNWAGKMVTAETWGVEDMRSNLENFERWLLRFSIDCPHKDVRKGCKEILRRAERCGAQLPVIPFAGPSAFIPLCDTVGLDFTEPSWTPVTPSSGPFDALSDDDEDGLNLSPRDSFAMGIMIPESKGSASHDDRSRSSSKGRTPSLGRTSRRPNLTSPQKSKRRHNTRRPIPKFLPKPREPSDEVRNLLLQAYNRTGRIGNMNKVLFCFPRFADVCRQLTDLFLGSDAVDGPLPQTWRIYLGIIAAAEKRCQYYISLLSEKFLTIQGDKGWLKGIEHTPPKLQRIVHLNMSLAHLPWTITAEDISRLVRVEDELELRWSVSEVMQAILIMSFYHGKSAMALAWGILPEPDLLGGTVKTSTPVAPFGSFAPSASLSADPASEHPVSMKASSHIDRMGIRGHEKNASLVGKKREPDIPEGLASNIVPEKWRKTPTGSIPYSSTSASPTGATTPVEFVPFTEKPELLQTESGQIKHSLYRNKKRRQSFEECGTSDDPLTLLANHAAGALSMSAPNSNSFVFHSSMSSVKPLPMLRDHILSPSSSSSSFLEPSSLNESTPINPILDDYTRFLCPESLELKSEQLDPNRDSYEFLPMEEFDWDRSATCIIGSYLESYVGLLDQYFKEAMDVDSEDDSFLFSPPVAEQPRKVKQAHFSHPPDDGSDRERTDRSARDFSSGKRSDSTHSQKGDNKSVKEAAWFYSLRLLNIQKDDFRYSDIKYLLDRPTRRYLKRICVQPDMVTIADWMECRMRNEEKCRLGLLASQARFLGEVLWGIKGVSEFLC